MSQKQCLASSPQKRKRKEEKLDVHGMSQTSDKRTNVKWTIGYPMDVLWTMCASRWVVKIYTYL
ncbi:Uncharacterized protein APZ42_029272 [Daphnia magna]|uniref:Uncharacterized protein n=1 Tax=Daphnia magna TaxID=35525 RepID=A0A164PS88_9CRUS|nr:Uncharacterized protein APZ42_029272 [Daphnia magna]